jgi:glutamate:GABA antiporter
MNDESANDPTGQTAPSGKSAPVRQLLAWPVMAFLIIASTGSIAQLSAASEYGLGAITIYLIPAIFFMIPSALISAELATGWDGGVFAWVREAFGDRFGFQAIWLQWIQSVALYPSLLAFAAGSLAYALGQPNLADNGLYTGTVILVIFWAATLVAFRGLNASARLSSVGLTLGTIIPAVALIVLMFVWLGKGNPSAVPLQSSDIVPTWNGLSSLVLIIGTFIAFAGLEVNAVHIRRMRDPERNYPKGVAVAVTVIFTMYVLGTISIAVAVPSSSLDLDAGAAQTFVTYMQGLGWGFGGKILSFLLAFGALAAASTWVIGPSRGLLLVGRKGFLPRRLQEVNAQDVQVPILVVQAVIVSLLSIAFVLIPSVSNAFWVLQTITVELYMLMYILMFTAGWRLRRIKSEVKRSFRVPALPLFAVLGTLAAIGAILIGFIPPSQLGTSVSPATYAFLLLVGILILAIPPQIIYHFRRRDWVPAQPEAAGDEVEPSG